MNSRVPLLAMVPRLCDRLLCDRPMPLSAMVSVLASLSKLTRTSRFGLVLVQRRLVERLEAQLVAGVRRVRDQLAQEDLLVGVQRVGDQVQQLLDLGLEGKGLFVHGSLSGGRSVRGLAATGRIQAPATGRADADHRPGGPDNPAPTTAAPGPAQPVTHRRRHPLRHAAARGRLAARHRRGRRRRPVRAQVPRRRPGAEGAGRRARRRRAGARAPACRCRRSSSSSSTPIWRAPSPTRRSRT